MVIEIPNATFRICGNNNDWSIQYSYTKNGETVWQGKYFYHALDFAIAKAYEILLRECPDTVDLLDVPAECERVKTELVKAVRKAVKQ